MQKVAEKLSSSVSTMSTKEDSPNKKTRSKRKIKKAE